MKQNKIYFWSVVFVLFMFIKSISSAQASAMAHLVINQVQVEGDGGTNDEFIEIYNPTANAVSFNGWSLQYKSSSGNFPLTSGKKNLPDAVIAAGGYYLVAHTAYNGAILADHIHSSFTLSGTSSGATIFLVNGTNYLTSGNDSVIVDKLGYGSSSNNSPEGNSAQTPASQQALIRTTDTDNNAADFTVVSANPRNSGSSSAPQPTPTPSPPPVGGTTPTPPSVQAYSTSITISEFMVNPDGPDNGEEWVELYNNYSGAVDVSGWILDDESAGDSVGSSAFILPQDSVIEAHGYLVVHLPEEAFALNNTGGDVLRLLWPNDQLADQVAYGSSAPEDQTYAKKTTGNFFWTKLVTKGSANQFSTGMSVPLTGEASDDLQVKINEIFPDPKGPDSGSEWVEFINSGTNPVSLRGWILDDGEVGEKIGSSAYTLESPVVQPGEVAQVMIPAGKFALNNTGTETVRIFNAGKILIDSISYEGGKEELSFAFSPDGLWNWVEPTPNSTNSANTIAVDEPQPEIKIIINEIFPEPEKGGEEFVELVNLGSAAADLSGWTLSDLSRSYSLGDLVLEPGQFKVIKKSASKLAFNNYGQETVSLADTKGAVVAEVEYEDAPKNQSYSRNDNGEYFWSAKITPGKANQFQAAAISAKKSNVTVSGLTDEDYYAPDETYVFGPEPELFEQAAVSDASLIPEVAGASVVANPGQSEPSNKDIGFFAGGLLVGVVIAAGFCYIGYRIYRAKESI